MTFPQEAVRDKPLGLYVLDDTSPFLDRTGLASAASFVGSSEAHGISLIAGSLFSQKANNSNKLAFPTSVYKAGRETQDFSLEASIRLVRGTDTKPIQILSHANIYDGLTIDGTEVTFSTAYSANVTNLFLNPSAETNTANWGSSGGSVTRSNTRAWVGSWSMLLPVAGNAWQTVTLPANKTYTVSAYVWIPSSMTGTVTPRVGSAAVSPPFNGPAITARDQWTRVSMTFTTDSDGGVLAFYPALGGAGAQTWVDGMMLTEGTELLDYFSGLPASLQAEGAASTTFDIQQDQEIHVVGVHTSSRNSLYINGTLVGEVNISDAQENYSYVSSDSALYTGESTGDDSLLINGVAFYPHALSGDSVKRHYMASVNMPSSHDVVGVFSGISTNPGLDAEGILFDRWWSTADDWKRGAMTGTAVLNDRLQPQFEEETSIPGDWSTSVDLTMNTTSISGISIFWSGKGATVEVSLDAITWVEASNGYRLPNIPPGFNPTDKDLFVRITFDGGIESDDSYIDNLNIVASRTESVTTLGGRSMGFSSASQRREYMVQSAHDNNGVVLGAGATVTLTPDFSESPDAFARTLELWLKAESTQPTISVSGTKYINGAASASNFPTNEWCLVHIVSGSDVTGAITITGPVQIGNIGIYNYSLTADDVTNVYNQYFANAAVRVDDNSAFSITQSGDEARLYGGAWTNGAVN